MKPSHSWTSVCRPLLPFALGVLASCSGSEPNPSPGSSGSSGAGGSLGSGGSAVGGGGASAGQAGSATAGASGSSAGGSGGTGTSGGSAGAGGSTGGSGGTAAGGGGMGGSTGGSAGTGGTGGAGGGNQTFGAAFKSVAQIIQGRCASVCHGQQEGLENRNDLRTADLDAFYTHLTTPLTVDICYGKKLVVPGNVKESLLVVAITGEENDCALIRMPTNCEGENKCVPPADIQAIESWIAAGAPKN